MSTELNRKSEPVVPNLEHIAQLVVHILEPIESGRNIQGGRRLIPITGGQVAGPRLFGRVLSVPDHIELNWFRVA
jgi:alkylated DNA nucleotide flippase Atl1